MMQSLELRQDAPWLAEDGSTSAVLQQEATGHGRRKDYNSTELPDIKLSHRRNKNQKEATVPKPPY